MVNLYLLCCGSMFHCCIGVRLYEWKWQKLFLEFSWLPVSLWLHWHCPLPLCCCALIGWLSANRNEMSVSEEEVVKTVGRTPGENQLLERPHKHTHTRTLAHTHSPYQRWAENRYSPTPTGDKNEIIDAFAPKWKRDKKRMEIQMCESEVNKDRAWKRKGWDQPLERTAPWWASPQALNENLCLVTCVFVCVHKGWLL